MYNTAVEKFENGFEDEEFEILALVKNNPGGASVYNEDWLCASVSVCAIIDCRNMEVIKKEGILCWLIKNTKHFNYGYNFKKYGIYRLLVKKAKFTESNKYMKASWNNRYLLLKVLKKNVHNEELKALADYYKKPLMIKNQLGEFTLDREFSRYHSEINIDSQRFVIELETDTDSDESAETAFGVLARYSEDLKGLDRRLKEYAAKGMLELANEWQEDEEEGERISEQMFVDRMSGLNLVFKSDGGITAYYNDGDLFFGHLILIEIDDKGNFSEADIAG